MYPYLCMPVLVHSICLSFVFVFVFFFCVCVELEAREPAIKKRTGTSKGLEAQTQHTCWQSIGKPGEVKLERERERKRERGGGREKERGDERGKKEEGRGSACGREGENQRKRGRAQTQAAHTHPLLSLQSGRGVREAACVEYVL